MPVVCLEFPRALGPLLKSGAVAMTSHASVTQVGYQSLEATLRALRGEPVPTFVEIRADLVDKGTMNRFIPEW